MTRMVLGGCVPPDVVSPAEFVVPEFLPLFFLDVTRCHPVLESWTGSTVTPEGLGGFLTTNGVSKTPLSVVSLIGESFLATEAYEGISLEGLPGYSMESGDPGCAGVKGDRSDVMAWQNPILGLAAGFLSLSSFS